MKALLWLLLLAALAVAVALGLHYNDGYVLLVLPPYRVEISLTLTILLVVGSFLVLHTLLRALALARALPQRVREFRQRRLDEKTNETLPEALRLMFEGRYDQALKKAAEAHAGGQSPALAALIAARCAQGVGDAATQKDWLELAAQSDAGIQSAALMLEAEMLIELHRHDEALAVLKRLYERGAPHSAALRLERRAHQGCGHTDEVDRLTRLIGDASADSADSTHGAEGKTPLRSASLP